jgi:transglutaminase-like putative cysteine protease
MNDLSNEQFFVPENMEAFPNPYAGFQIAHTRNFYRSNKGSFYKSPFIAGATFSNDAAQPVIRKLSAENIFHMERARKEHGLLTKLGNALFIPDLGVNESFSDLAKKRYEQLMEFSRSLKNKPKTLRIDECYRHLKENIAYVNSTDLEFGGEDYCLSTGEGVCRHYAPLFFEMLNFADVESRMISGWKHVWNRVDDSDFGSFDLDLSWYITPTKLPPRKGFCQKSWKYIDWFSEFVKLNEGN